MSPRAQTKEIRIGQTGLLRMLRLLRAERNEERVGSSLGSEAFRESAYIDSLIQSIESLEPTYHYFITADMKEIKERLATDDGREPI